MHRLHARTIPTLALGLSLLVLLGTTSLPAYAYKATVPATSNQQKRMLTGFYYEAAIQVAGQGGLDLSLQLLDKAYRLNREDIEAGIVYAQMLQSQGQYDKALDIYEEMLAQFSDPKHKATLYYFISLAYNDSNRPNEAISSLKEAIRLFPGTAPVDFYYDIGVYYSKLNRYDQTRDYSKKALETAPKSSAAWNNFGYSLAKLGNYQEGYTAIRKSLDIDPENPNALDSMGYVLFQMGRFQESAIEYEKALQKDPKLADSLLYLGRSYEALQVWPKAIHAYEKYLELAEDTPEKADLAKKLKTLQTKEFLREQSFPQPSDANKTPLGPEKVVPEANLSNTPSVEDPTSQNRN
jgi:tetratricopeptide (TPR) repeat protein